MRVSPSEYYPPRGNVPFRHSWFALCRWFGTTRISHLPATLEALNLRHVFLGLAIPGMGFYLGGKRWIAALVWLIYPMAMLVYFVWLGTATANAAGGLMLSLHTISVAFLLHRTELDLSLGKRAILSLITFLALLFLIYGPAVRLINQRLALPLMTPDGMVIINRLAGHQNVEIGGTVAYILPTISDAGLWIREGHGFDRVLAGPGDVIQFAERQYFVNGRAAARQANMPVAGDLVVPEKCWFIWPASISIQANNFPGVPALLKRMALVEEAQIIGRPCQRWFWRRQTGYEPVLQP